MADGDVAGVTISFVDLDVSKLTNCLNNNIVANRYALQQALIKVTGPVICDHDETITEYFANTYSKGAYLIAEKSVNFFINCYSGNVITATSNINSMWNELNYVNEILENGLYIDEHELDNLLLNKYWLERIPNALEDINNAANPTEIYNSIDRTITVQDKNNLTIHEMHAILAFFTGDVTFNSFAAEVEFHADMLIDWGETFDKIKKSALRADMSTGETYERGVLEDYYNLNSTLVQNQAAAHGEY